MNVKLPEPSLQLSGSDIIITLDNFETGDEWNIYRSDGPLWPIYKIVTGHTQASYTLQNPDLEKNYQFRISLNNAPLSVSVGFVEDHTDEDPPYYVIEEKSGYPITPNLVTIPVSWGPDLVDLQFYQIENAIAEWFLSPPRTLIGRNQTL